MLPADKGEVLFNTQTLQCIHKKSAHFINTFAHACDFLFPHATQNITFENGGNYQASMGRGIGIIGAYRLFHLTEGTGSAVCIGSDKGQCAYPILVKAEIL